MSPFIAIAASILPEILKSIIGGKAGEKAGKVADAVAEAVTDAAGTKDAAEAQKKIDDDPKLAAELRIKLAEIAAEEEEKRRQADLKAQKLQLQEAEEKQEQQLAALKLQMEQDDKNRQAQLERFQANIEDTKSARSAFKDLAAMRSPMAWGAPIVSFIIVLGFFIILYKLFGGTELPLANSPGFQIINIAVGALTAAFATVVSFWLGSSQGSRQKDAANFDLQAKQSEDTAEVLKKQAEQTAIVLEQKREAPVSPPKPEKGADESNFRSCVDVILAKEGGYVDHKKDPGGATNMGITFNTLSAWRHEEITKQDVKDLTVEEARQIYQANYWNALSCDDLPSGVDLVVFDFGVNAGPGQSAKILQKVVGTNADGVIGPITLGAANSLKPENIIRRFGELRMEYYLRLPTFRTFGRGWTKRTEEVERTALKMVA